MSVCDSPKTDSHASGDPFGDRRLRPRASTSDGLARPRAPRRSGRRQADVLEERERLGGDAANERPAAADVGRAPGDAWAAASRRRDVDGSSSASAIGVGLPARRRPALRLAPRWRRRPIAPGGGASKAPASASARWLRRGPTAPPRPGPTGTPTVARVALGRGVEQRRPAASSSSCGHAGAARDEPRLERARLRAAPDEDDVIGRGRVDQVVEDRRHDRLGRDRARQAAQDPGEALGLAAAARLEAGDGVSVRDRRDGGQDDQRRRSASRSAAGSTTSRIAG